MMTLYYSDILSARRACAAVRYLNAPVEYEYLDLVKGAARCTSKTSSRDVSVLARRIQRS